MVALARAGWDARLDRLRKLKQSAAGFTVRVSSRLALSCPPYTYLDVLAVLPHSEPNAGPEEPGILVGDLGLTEHFEDGTLTSQTTAMAGSPAGPEVKTEFSALGSENDSEHEHEVEGNATTIHTSPAIQSNPNMPSTDAEIPTVVDDDDTARSATLLRFRLTELYTRCSAYLSPFPTLGSLTPRHIWVVCRCAADSDSAKQPKSSFMLFYQDRFKDKRGFYPGKSTVEIAQMLGQEWQALPEEDKARCVPVGGPTTTRPCLGTKRPRFNAVLACS